MASPTRSLRFIKIKIKRKSKNVTVKKLHKSSTSAREKNQVSCKNYPLIIGENILHNNARLHEKKTSLKEIFFKNNYAKSLHLRGVKVQVSLQSYSMNKKYIVK